MRDSALHLTVWAAFGIRQFLETLRLVPSAHSYWRSAQSYWRGLERSFSRVDGEIEARRTLQDGKRMWTLSATGSADPEGSIRTFQNCARAGARTSMQYRWNTSSPRDLVNAWLDLVAADEISRQDSTADVVLPAAVEASKRAAARLAQR